jgi:hypothetical protein
VREDTVRRPDGSPGIYGVVEKPDFALVLPRWSGGFWLVEQYRYPVRRRAWEFPQGSWGSGGTGTRSNWHDRSWPRRPGFQLGDGPPGASVRGIRLSTQGFDVYLATGLTEGGPDREISEQDMQHQAFTDKEVEQLIVTGQLVDAPSLAGLTLYRLQISAQLTDPMNSVR